MIDALRYEYVRLRTIRSTYWLIGLVVTFQLIMTMILAWQIAASSSLTTGDDAFDILATIGASTGIPPLFIAYIIGLLGVFSFGHEYRHGMIRATLTALPSRRTVFAAKVISTALVSASAALACIVIALVSLLVFGLDLPSGENLFAMTAGTVVFAALFSLSGLAYAALTRNQTAAVALLLLLPSLAEQLIRAIVLLIKSKSDDPGGTSGIVQVLKFLPYDAGGQMYTRASIDDLLSFVGYRPFGAVGGGIVMAVFVAALLAGAYALFLRRDA
jgi:ABC-2 type transport system permease protein